MREFEVTVRIRNNRLKERRESLGMSQADLANAAGISHGVYMGLETLRISPRRGNNQWRKVALKIADFHCVDPEELFPESVQAIKTSVAVRRLNASEIYPLLSTHTERRMLASPEDALGEAEEIEAMRRAFADLSPREQDILQRRFGLDGEEPMDLWTVGERWDIAGERTRQISEAAMAKIRHRLTRHPALGRK